MAPHVSRRVRFSVAITVRNDRANLEALLASLEKQTRTPDEVVVVDAYSTDGTWEVTEAFAARAAFPVVAVQERGNRGVGRTRCVELATGEAVAFIDSDCTVSQDWLERFVRAWDEESAKSPKPLGAIGGANNTPPGSTDLMQAIDDVMSPMEEQSFHGINTINCVYLKAAVEAAGFFDASLHTAEDPDLNARIAKKGYHLTRVENPCWHKRRDSWKKLVRQHYEYGIGAWTLLYRHPEYFPWQEYWVAPIGSVLVLALVGLGAVLGQFGLILLAALGLALVPLVAHRHWVKFFFDRHGVSGAWFRRLAILWIVYVPYQAGILMGRLKNPRPS